MSWRPLIFHTFVIATVLSVRGCHFGDVQLPQFSATAAQFHVSVPHRVGAGVAELGRRAVGGDLAAPVQRSDDEDQPAEGRRHRRALHGSIQSVLLRHYRRRDRQSRQ